MIGAPTKEKKEFNKNPGVDSFKINGKLTGEFEDVARMLSAISFLEIAMESNAVNVAYVESRDINNKPYLFSLMKIKKDHISVVYSIPKNIAPKKRRIDIIRQLLNILNIIDEYYIVDNKVVYNLIEKAVKEVGELVDKKSTAIYVEYDTLKNENTILNKKMRILEKEIEELKNTNYELRQKNNEMQKQMIEYETPSDETLKAKVQEWIKDHNGKINISDFASIYLKGSKIGEKRVEGILNELITEGYLSVAK